MALWRILIGIACFSFGHATDATEYATKADILRLENEIAKTKVSDAPVVPKKAIKVMSCLINNVTLDDPDFINSTDKLAFFFNDIRARANCDIMQPLVDGFWFKAFGWILVVQWHVRFRFGRIFQYFICQQDQPKHWKPLCTWRKVGLNIVIFMTWFGPQSDDKRPLITSLIIIFFDTVFLYYGTSFAARGINHLIPDLKEKLTRVPSSSKKFEIEALKDNLDLQFDLDETMNATDDFEDDGNVDNKSSITSKYEDITLKLRRVVPIYFVQIILISMYIQQLNIGGDPDNDVDIAGAREDISKVDPIRWLAAIMLQMYCGDDQTGEAFSMTLWMKLLGKDLSQKFSPRLWSILEILDGDDGDISSLEKIGTATTHIFHIFPIKLRYEFCVRCFMDFCINSVGRSIIMYTFPIMLSVEGPLDFVKDCTAVLFISQLDDIESKDIKEVIIKRKIALREERSAPSEGYNRINDRSALQLTTNERNYFNENKGKFEKLTDYNLVTIEDGVDVS